MLPEHLSLRVEPHVPPPRPGRYVLYWMRVAARATENPALDVALTLGRALGLPVFVYQGLSARHRYASDRLHTFILEGARDVHRALGERGIGAAFHLETHRSTALRSLAAEAAVVVTDVMPGSLFRGWDEALRAVAPLWRVDASCVAPLWRFPVALTSAAAFHAAAASLWHHQLAQPWVDVEPHGPPFVPALPFEPVALDTTPLSALVAGCDIDHTIGPVHHTPGGTVAGLARWRRFADEKLGRYHLDRRDPLREGTSRLSAYLHFGHLSPFTVAREALAHRTDGATAFLEQLLTWRELAWHFCLHHPEPESLATLPPWARATLAHHERDPREALYSWEQLARAQTGHSLWDAAQRHLLTHGTLHNAMRMTWAKAVLQWTRTTQETLTLLVDLNHRYALDGRDPSSAAGILWCLGAMDRPFTPEVPVLGSVRPRPLAEQARRIDVAEYERRAWRPSRGQPLTIAVVGAGVAGVAAGRALRDAGHAVTLFEQASTLGGRLGSLAQGSLRFDVGAPSFSVSDERFARFVRAYWHERLVTEWKPVLADPEPTSSVRLVAVPHLSALVTRLATGLDVRLGVSVGELVREERWRVKDQHGEPLGEYDVVVVATPAPVAARLVDPSSFPLASRLREVTFSPAWTLALGFAQATGVAFDLAEHGVGPLVRLVRESSKPEQRGPERWVVEASAEWSERHRDVEPRQVVAPLVEAFFAATGAALQSPSVVEATWWPQARPVRPLAVDCVWDEALRLAVCGDWCLGADVQAAFLSGSAAAGRINALPAETPEPDSSLPRRAAQLRLW